jgi:hypothetical protein
MGLEEVTRQIKWALFGALLAGGCVGDAELDAELDSELAAESAELATAIPRSTWEAAPAGCEDVDRLALGLAVRATEGEPSLAALVDLGGEVRCVDAAWLISDLETYGVDPLAGDPSPEPAHRATQTRVEIAGKGIGPVPTPTNPDPTPTPVLNAQRTLIEEGPTLVQRDPTPTPTTQD